MSEQLDTRKIIWSAFSELWLDNSIEQCTLDSIALKMKLSGYSLAELKHIYQHEVGPAVYRNLLVVAGIWDGFNEEWLHAEIQKQIDSQNLWTRYWFFIRKPMMFYATKHHWTALEQLFISDTDND